MVMKLTPTVIPVHRQISAAQGQLQGFDSRQVQLKGNPLEYNRFQGTVGQAMNTPLAKLRAYYYFVKQFQFPLTTAEFDAELGGSMPLFVENANPCPGFQTNAAMAFGVNEPFCVLGVTVVASGKGFGFSLPGRMVAAPAGGDCVPVVGDATCPAAGERDAVLDYGGSHWRFIEAFAKSFRLQMAVWRRYLVVDESLEDIGIMPAAEFQGAGHALINVHPFVREVNDVLASKDCTLRFLPQNHAGTECLGAQTAEVIYGHNSIRGASNSRVFCLNQPICYTPGMRLDVQYTRVENDCCFQPAMRQASVLDCGTPTLPDAGYTDEFCDGAGGFPGVYNVPGGCLSLGIVLMGYSLTPAACLDYYLSVGVGSIQAQMLSGNAYAADLLRKAQSDATLRQVLQGHKEEAVNRFAQTLSGPPQV